MFSIFQMACETCSFLYYPLLRDSDNDPNVRRRHYALHGDHLIFIVFIFFADASTFDQWNSNRCLEFHFSFLLLAKRYYKKKNRDEEGLFLLTGKTLPSFRWKISCVVTIASINLVPSSPLTT